MPCSWKWRSKASGYKGRWSRARDLVLDFLSHHKGHFSAKDIYTSLHHQFPRLGLATVYRTLELLTHIGFLTRLITADGQNRYEFKPPLPENHHHHLICLRCGQIWDTTDFVQEEVDLVHKMEKAIREKHRFLIADHQMAFYGFCPHCQKETT